MYFIFPGVYSKRFKGISKAKHEGIGYKIPSKQEMEKMLESLVKLENNTFLVSSSSGNIRYMVDMNSGFCQCKIGYNGSPCKHQYVLWISKLAPCTNFLPIFNKDHRQLFSEIAIGKTAPLECYEGLHDRVLELPTQLQSAVPFEYPCSDVLTSQSNHIQFDAQDRRTGHPDPITKEECEGKLKEAFASVVAKINCNDQNFCRGVLKFSDRLQRMPISKLTRELHTFGASGVANTRITATSIVKKAKRGKIHVQPEAVKRRKIQCGSKSKKSKGQNKKNNPFQPKAGNPKRAHKFAENVRKNQPVSKKAGRTMTTKTRCYELSKVSENIKQDI